MKENLITKKRTVVKLMFILIMALLFSGCGKKEEISATEKVVEQSAAMEEAEPQMEDVEEKKQFAPRLEVKEEVKPQPASQPELKEEPKTQPAAQPEVKEEPKPQPAPQPEVKEEPKSQPVPQPEVKEEAKPQPAPQPEVKEEPKTQPAPQPEVKEEPKPQPAPQPETKEETTEQSVKNEIPDQLDMSQIGDIFVSAEEYDKKVSDSEVGITK